MSGGAGPSQALGSSGYFPVGGQLGYRWEYQLATDFERLGELLRQGWEPFAAHLGRHAGFVYHLRRQTYGELEQG